MIPKNLDPVWVSPYTPVQVATVFQSRRRFRVVVYSNDHAPAHVHALGKGLDARFRLNCPDGPVEFWDHQGDWRLQDLGELGGEIAGRIADCCRIWSEIYG